MNMHRHIAKLDICRDKRCGIPEAILAQAKPPHWVAKLLIEMAQKKGLAIATRADEKYLEEIKAIIPTNLKIQHYPIAKVIAVSKKDYYNKVKFKSKIGLIAAGTADIPVAEEAKVIMELLGAKVISSYDIGIAGIHRLVLPIKKLLKEKVCCIIVAAGMEGALPTVVKGLVDMPVIGVPTSVGYGYGGKGESALMSMLQSCSPGVVVVNIDNGFGAAAAAILIAKTNHK